jgi:hypothetical protein
MSDDLDMDRKGWLGHVITIPNIIAVGAMLIGGAMTYQAQVGKMDHLESFVKQNEMRIERLEHRMDEERAANNAIFMRSDVLSEQLRSIRDEQVRIREQMQLMRRDLR